MVQRQNSSMFQRFQNFLKYGFRGNAVSVASFQEWSDPFPSATDRRMRCALGILFHSCTVTSCFQFCLWKSVGNPSSIYLSKVIEEEETPMSRGTRDEAIRWLGAEAGLDNHNTSEGLQRMATISWRVSTWTCLSIWIGACCGGSTYQVYILIIFSYSFVIVFWFLLLESCRKPLKSFLLNCWMTSRWILGTSSPRGMLFAPSALVLLTHALVFCFLPGIFFPIFFARTSEQDMQGVCCSCW